MPISWRIEMFGGLRLQSVHAPELNDQKVVVPSPLTRFRSRQAGALLAFLAYFPGSHGREVLAEILWPDHDPHLSRAHLRVVLASLRQILEPTEELSGSILLTDRHTIELNGPRLTTDVAEFEAALQAATQATDRAAQNVHLERAVGCYRGSLLSGHYDEWIMPEAQRLEEGYFAVLRRLISGWEDEGDLERALHLARRGASIDALREDVTRDLMRLYAAMGQPVLAVRQYRELERSFEQLSTTPSLQTRELLRRIQDELKPAEGPLPPPNHTTAAPPTAPLLTQTRSLADNQVDLASSEVLTVAGAALLPVQWTRFFGREAEVATLQELLRGGTRLITLLGTGGSGKTRLALEVARLLTAELESDQGALWFVPLTEVIDAGQVGGEVARALHLSLDASADPLVAVIQALSALPRTILVLDNFEQLLPAGAAALQELLARLPRLQILLTSRRELGLSQEHVFPLPPLPVPPLPVPASEGARDLAPETLLNFAGVRLFHDRARAASPGFGITKHNAPALATLCARLDGLPLAIELCAARAGSLSPSKMLRRLERRLDFLAEVAPVSVPDATLDAGAASTPALDRHSTLRATLEWSFKLLWPQLARFFAFLSVFRGSYTAHAAAQVAQEPHAAHFLEQLRAASLAVRETGTDEAETDEARTDEAGRKLDPQHSGQVRFRLLETVREFAAEQLSAGEIHDLRQRHAHFYRELAQSEHQHIMAANAHRRAASGARMRPEHANFRAALTWSLEHDPVLALHLVHLTSPLWNDGVSHSEHLAEQSLERALERAPNAPPELVSAVLGIAATNAQHRGDYERQRVLSERRLAWLAGSPNEPVNAYQSDLDAAWALFNLGCAAEGWCQYEAATGYFEQALQKFLGWENLGPEALQNVAWTLGRLGECASQNGDLDAASTHLQQGADVFRRCEDHDGLAGLVGQLGDVARKKGDFPAARAFFAESERLEREVGDRRAHPWRRLQVAQLNWAQGDLLAARHGFANALRDFSKTQVLDPTLRCLLFLGCLALEEGDASDALRLLGCEAAQRESHGIPAPPECRAARERALQQARTALPEGEFEATTRRGRALTLQKAVALALRRGL